MATTRTTILLDVDLLDRLERLVRRTGTTKTATIAAALDAYLADHDPGPELGFLAYGRSGHGRLSIDGRAIVTGEAAMRRRPGG